MKKAGLMLVLVFMITALIGCTSTNTGGDSNASGGENDKVELKFMMWGNQAHIDVYNKLIDGFTKENPGIKVTMESVPFADYQQKISVLAAGGSPPDLAWVSERMIPQFKSNQILADLSAFKDDAQFKLDDYIPSTLDLFREGDQLLGLPFSTPPVVMFYNKTLFDKAGLTDPNTLVAKGEWTWEQFEASAKAITSKDAANRIYGANFFATGKPGRCFLRTPGLMEAGRSTKI